MAQFNISQRLGIPDLSQTSATALVPVGTVIRYYDDVVGQSGEAMYVQFVAATTVGQVCYLNNTSKATKASTTHANKGYSLGVCLAISAATDEYGWVQVSGKAKIKAGTVAAGAAIWLTATAGQVDDLAVAGSQIVGAILDTADGTPAAGFAYATIDRPSIQTQIT